MCVSGRSLQASIATEHTWKWARYALRMTRWLINTLFQYARIHKLFKLRPSPRLCRWRGDDWWCVFEKLCEYMCVRVCSSYYNFFLANEFFSHFHIKYAREYVAGFTLLFPDREKVRLGGSEQGGQKLSYSPLLKFRVRLCSFLPRCCELTSWETRECGSD